MPPVDPIVPIRLQRFDLTVSLRPATVIVLIVLPLGAVVAAIPIQERPDTVLPWLLIAFTTLGGLSAVVTLHAAVRVFVARATGLGCRRVSLGLTGLHLEHRFTDATPRRETFVGLAGMLALATLALVSLVALRFTAGSSGLGVGVVTTLATATIGLAVLHTLPAANLDGGRVLRGAMWYLWDSSRAAARAVALYSRVVGAMMVAIGLVMFGFGGSAPFWGAVVFFIGWSVSGAARTELLDARWRRRGQFLRLGDITPLSRTVDATAPLDEALEALAAARGAPILVVGDRRAVIGIVMLSDIRGQRRSAWADRIVSDIMRPLERFVTLPSDTIVADAIAVLEEQQESSADTSYLIMTTGTGRVVAIVSREQIIGRLLGRRI